MKYLLYKTVEPAPVKMETQDIKANENQIEELIHPENQENISNLILMLENEMNEKWISVKSRMINSEILEFAEQIIDLGNKYNSTLISNWGNELSKQIKNFDIENLTKSIEFFPELIKKISNYNNSQK